MDALQRLQALVQEEGGVVDQHVDVAHKLLSRATGEVDTQTDALLQLITIITLSGFASIDLHTISTILDGTLK